MNYSTLAENTIPEGVAPLPPLSEMMNKANALADELFALTGRINEHMFVISPANEEELPNPRCFRDALNLHGRTLDKTVRELQEIASKLGV